MAMSTVVHLNFRGDAREALEFYRSVSGGELTIVRYGDLGAPEDPAQADEVMWGQVVSSSGFHVMAYDVQTSRTWDRGVDPFYVSLRGATVEEITSVWEKLAEGATIREPLGPAAWGPAYGMLTDRFGVTWVLDVAAEYAAS
ncbi:VOC family protein [Actinomycetospora endophytica]|uniref:VOC family protein n=1 Tax=Actinomycetospora endophytica TaxID=2291215 RepID=A0ABS8P8U0_9PSEU|nr:VOC family protein [Actinomycetospora endophytica]MCD2194658.1 VOC family protein [Actinomycetospora endophytica]